MISPDAESDASNTEPVVCDVRRLLRARLRLYRSGDTTSHLRQWRASMSAICRRYGVSPANEQCPSILPDSGSTPAPSIDFESHLTRLRSDVFDLLSSRCNHLPLTATSKISRERAQATAGPSQHEHRPDSFPRVHGVLGLYATISSTRGRRSAQQ